MLWVGCEVSLQLLRSPSAPLPRDPHPTATPTSVLPTPLEAQQRLTLPETPLTGLPPTQATTLVLV